jgi:predicted TIM-barrel fold metal-dependent hydrolase
MPPPPDLQRAATAEAYIEEARKAGVNGALVVQPANHLYDHSYVAQALKAHPTFFRGMALANPTLSVEKAVAELERLQDDGFVAVRFNAGNFDGGLASPVGRALYRRAGELGMPVGILAFNGLAPFVSDLKKLCTEFPKTQLLLDHLGFFRQPAIGGQASATNDEATWRGVLELAEYPQVFVKVSALFRASGQPPPFADLEPRVQELLRVYGAERLLWGSDFPFCLPGGFPLPEGETSTPARMSYAAAAEVPRRWALDDDALQALMGGTAAKLFALESC